MDLVSKTKSIIIGCNFLFKILVCMADIQVAAVLAKKFPFIRKRDMYLSVSLFEIIVYNVFLDSVCVC